MSNEKWTLGKAIDQAIEAIEKLEPDARKTALDAVCKHLGIELAPVTNSQPPMVTPTSAQAVSATAGGTQVQANAPPKQDPPRKTDIRTLKTEKAPSSARQMACLVAFYLQEHAPDDEKKSTVNTSDLEKYFKQAGFKLPTKLS